MNNNILADLFENINNIEIPKNTKLEFEARYELDNRKYNKHEYNKNKGYDKEFTEKLAKNLMTYGINNKKISCEQENTINLYKNDSQIKRLIFINGKKNIDHYQKIKLIEPIIVLPTQSSPGYKLHLSFEKDIPEFDAKDCINARIKVRFSMQVFPDWRLDITLLKNINNFNNPVELKKAKEEMIYDINIADFVEKAPWKIAEFIEFEFEYIGNTSLLSINSLLQINNFMNPFVRDITHKNIVDKNTSPYGSTLYEIAKWINPENAYKIKTNGSLKMISNQVIELDKNTYLRYVASHITDYYITDKIDGLRTILYIKDGICQEITNAVREIKLNEDTSETFIFDCEKYEDKYYIFDIMVWKSSSIIDKTFEERLELFPDALTLFHDILLKKEFIRLTDDYINQIKNMKRSKKIYETDGIILTPYDGKYAEMKVYKYKPADKLTIDFLIMECPPRLLGINPYINKENHKLYVLFSGAQRFVVDHLRIELIKYYFDLFPKFTKFNLPFYIPVQFEPSDKNYAYLFWSTNLELNNKIGEFLYDTKDSKWNLVRIRDDRDVDLQSGRYFGNNYRVAEMNWQSIQNPLVIEDTKTEDTTVYFQSSKNELQKASRNFNSFVKSQLLAEYKNLDRIMDMASGNGQDLFRYANNGIKSLLFLEIDKTAIMELITRKYDFAESKMSGKMDIKVCQMNLNDDYKDNIKKLETNLIMPNSGYNIIICNFAFHYLVESKKSVVNICKFINNFLAKGGRFIFSSFDGKKIVKLLKENKGKWTSKISGKFEIMKKYQGDTLESFGQKISVLLPFSSGNYYDEYLINIDYISSELVKFNINLEIDVSFDTYLDDYMKKNKNGYDQMDDDDKKYVGLYHYYTFYKMTR